MLEPLNSQLYKALQDRISTVIVGNEGERYSPCHAGEYYRVHCPECGDTRHRLWVNHMFGKTTVENGRRTDNLHLMICYNEGCFRDYQERRAFHDRVFPFSYGRRIRHSELPVVATPESAPAGPLLTFVALPQGLLPLHDPRAARAAEYLACRGFDPGEIAQRWQVQYDPGSDRILVPVHHLWATFDANEPYHVFLAGWQSRFIGAPPPGVPKYLTMKGLPKSRVLYGLERAYGAYRRGSMMMVVEGVTDAWTFGNDAVATLGKSISREQLHLLIEHAQNRVIVVAFDREAITESQKTATLIRETRRAHGQHEPVVVLRLPPGRADVGECTRQEAWEAAWAAQTSRVSGPAPG